LVDLLDGLGIWEFPDELIPSAFFFTAEVIDTLELPKSKSRDSQTNRKMALI